ncbi:MAG: oligosaccharide flippase family protein [Gemmatimonadetes bacterium]|nr:oligosaccharide flippase family protein [Gemmatimonadota bacterium]
MARQAVVHGLNVVAGTLLARHMTSAGFGVYGIVTYLLTFLIATSDLGLGASLVRGRVEPESRDLQTVLSIQHLLTFTFAASLWAAAPALRDAYRLPAEATLMFRVIAVGVPLTAFQSVSSIRLERHLAFPQLATSEIAQAIVFNGLLLGLVLTGHGLLSFGIALVCRALTGAVLAWSMSPWPVGWRWDLVRVRSMLRFGLPYQGIGLISLAKDAIMPGFVAAVAGASALGEVQWALMVSSYPVFAVFALQRVYLPSFARMGEHAGQLPRMVERVLQMTHALAAPLAVLTLALIEPITHIVFGDKWLPALPLFYALWVANLFVPTTTPLMSLLNALGRSRTTFGFAVLWMVMTWAIGVPAILRFGIVGFAWTNVAVQLSNLWLFHVAQREVTFGILRSVWRPWLAALVMGVAVRGVARVTPVANLSALAALGVAALLLYAALLSRLSPGIVRRVLKPREA